MAPTTTMLLSGMTNNTCTYKFLTCSVSFVTGSPPAPVMCLVEKAMGRRKTCKTPPPADGVPIAWPHRPTASTARIPDEAGHPTGKQHASSKAAMSHGAQAQGQVIVNEVLAQQRPQRLQQRRYDEPDRTPDHMPSLGSGRVGQQGQRPVGLEGWVSRCIQTRLQLLVAPLGCIPSARAHQVIMRALLQDGSIRQHHNMVGVGDSTEPVANDQRLTPAPFFCAGGARISNLSVLCPPPKAHHQQQQRCIRQSARAMATRWRCPPDRVMPFRRQVCHTLAACAQYPHAPTPVALHRSMAWRSACGHTNGNVLRQRAGEQKRLLRHPTNGLAQGLQPVGIQRVLAHSKAPIALHTAAESAAIPLTSPEPVGPTRPTVRLSGHHQVDVANRPARLAGVHHALLSGTGCRTVEPIADRDLRRTKGHPTWVCRRAHAARRALSGQHPSCRKHGPDERCPRYMLKAVNIPTDRRPARGKISDRVRTVADTRVMPTTGSNAAPQRWARKLRVGSRLRQRKTQELCASSPALAEVRRTPAGIPCTWSLRRQNWPGRPPRKPGGCDWKCARTPRP